MREKDRVLAAKCTEAAGVASHFLQWSDQYQDLVGQDFQAIKRDFNRYSTQLTRLARAADRPMAVAVFGPSQSGKSYLISAMARAGEKALQAKIGAESVDFLKEINPEGGKESTGIVTRFTVRENELPYPDRAVKTRLLDQLDIIKILGNSFLSDVDPGSIPVLEGDELQLLIQQGQANAKAHSVDQLSSADVYDLREYFTRYFRGVARIRMLDEPFWDSAAELIPRLAIHDRAQFMSVFWGGNEAFTNLYIRLYNALSKLGFSGESFAPLGSPSQSGALLPRSQSVIDVAALSGLGADSSDTLSITASSGATHNLQRCEFAALISELVIQIEEIPYPYFEFTDLLDFPGYRSREQIRDLDYFLAQEHSIESLFLRGKVAYLFQRYREERELTSMLLCIADSNQEVKSLPDVIDEWIKNTHGETPSDRQNKPISLFLVLTKFDKEFDRKGGGGDTLAEFVSKWKTRMHSSLWDFFGKQHAWPMEWDERGAFNNTFWIRNPKYEAPHLFQYDDQGREIQLLTAGRETQRIEGLKQAFLTTPEVFQHFKEPEKAWNSALMPNDGGISYLAEELGAACDPDLKYNQITAQLNGLKRDISSRIRDFYVGDDTTALINKRIENSREVVIALAKTAKAERFGSLISRLYIAESTLKEIYIKLEKECSADLILVSESTSNDGDILSALGLEASAPSDDDGTRMQSFSELFSKEVVSAWVSKLHDLADDGLACSFHFLPEHIALDFIKEIKAGFVRHKIREQIEAKVNESTRLRLNVHEAIALPTRLSANLINDYINYLGFDNVDPEQRPKVQNRAIFDPQAFDCGPPTLQETPDNYDTQYVMDWLKGFLTLSEQNAMTDTGMSTDPQANEKLGELITTLEEQV